MSGDLRFFAFALLLTATLSSASSLAEEHIWWDPQPLPDDVSFPLPGVASLLFRPVEVRGPDYWDIGRVVTLGNQSGGLFEDPYKVEVAGSFPSGTQAGWTILLGKYEVTKGQYAAVMGNGDIVSGLKVLAQRSGDPLDKKLAATPAPSERDLAKPLTWISTASILEFVETLNHWCFRSAECFARLPRVGGAPGFFRLPSEVEWEFGARGGTAALDNGAFKEKTPFPPQDWQSYAWAAPVSQSNTTRIGRFKPTSGGFFDMFGNAAEQMTERFYTEWRQGRPGGAVVRGGSFLDQGADLRSSLRREVSTYQWDGGSTVGDTRSPTVGIRLAVGSDFVATPALFDQIKASYERFRSRRAATPAGRSLSDGLVAAGDPLDAVEALLQRARSTGREPDYAAIETQLAQLRRLLRERGEAAAIAAARLSLANLAELSRAIDQQSRDLKLLDGAPASTDDPDVVLRIQSLRNRIEAADKLITSIYGRYADRVGELFSLGSDYSGTALTKLDAQFQGAADRLYLAIVEQDLRRTEALGGADGTDRSRIVRSLQERVAN
ncbi:SUMF1/EgtB/PvdO family nonheme iron enzyme [Mesorhizobium helmanticense]|nr:SUMF1/EgtB/PvdO family nonheme iron enzyme [Mesorhizobium helmanticense]